MLPDLVQPPILVTAYDDRYAPMGDLVAGRLRLWGETMGMDLHVARDLSPERPFAWAKIPLVHKLLFAGHDPVIWVDADALVMRPDADLRPTLAAQPDRALFLAIHHTWVEPMPGMAVRYDTPNTGVMALRRTPWMLNFLEQVWALDRYLTHPWWENAAVVHLMGYHRLLDPQARNTPDPEVMAQVAPLDWTWNSVPGFSEVSNPVIRHYTRRGSFEERLAEMRADLQGVEGAGD